MVKLALGGGVNRGKAVKYRADTLIIKLFGHANLYAQGALAGQGQMRKIRVAQGGARA